VRVAVKGRRRGAAGLRTDPSGMIHISLSFEGVNEKATLENSSAGVINETARRIYKPNVESALAIQPKGISMT
jgi:hypothetical protein